MTEIHFSSYRTSTITCNANIGSGININLDILFDNINIKEECFDDKEGIVWIQYVTDGEDVSRGTFPKKKRKSEHLLEGFMAAKRTDDKRSATPSTQLRASACW